MLTRLRAPSNPITVVAVAVLAAVWAPGAKTAKAGKTFKVRYGVTNDARLQAKLSRGRKSLTKRLHPKAGTNTLKWKLPKTLAQGKYTLKLLYQGKSKASTKVKVAA